MDPHPIPPPFRGREERAARTERGPGGKSVPLVPPPGLAPLRDRSPGGRPPPERGRACPGLDPGSARSAGWGSWTAGYNDTRSDSMAVTEHRLIALTGATGFIGRRLMAELPQRGFRVRVLLRRPSDVALDCGSAVIGDLARPQNMAAALADVDAVIHSAGVAHAMSGRPADDYRVLNTEATIALARAA